MTDTVERPVATTSARAGQYFTNYYIFPPSDVEYILFTPFPPEPPDLKAIFQQIQQETEP